MTDSDEYDLAREVTDPSGRPTIHVSGPSELASWCFPHEPEEDQQRIALRHDIVEAIEGRADPIEVARRYFPDNPGPLAADITELAADRRASRLSRA
jgi:hypothetical protein